MVATTVKLDKKLYGEVERIARAYRVDISEVVRIALREYVKNPKRRKAGLITHDFGVEIGPLTRKDFYPEVKLDPLK